MSEALEALSYLLPLLDKRTVDKEVLDIMGILIERNINESALRKEIERLSDPVENLEISLGGFIRKNDFKSAIGLLNKHEFETWFMNSERCLSLSAFVHDDKHEFAEKAFEANPSDLNLWVYVKNLILLRKKKKASQLAKKLVRNDQESWILEFLYNEFKFKNCLLELFDRYPHRDVFCLGLIEIYRKKKDQMSVVKTAMTYAENGGKNNDITQIIRNASPVLTKTLGIDTFLDGIFSADIQ